MSIACVAGLASASVASSAALALALAGASTTTSAAIDAISYEIVVVYLSSNGVPQQLRAIVVALAVTQSRLTFHRIMNVSIGTYAWDLRYDECF